jgi:hypothetical protein
MPKTADTDKTPTPASFLDPTKVIKDAIGNVPVVRWAYGVAGVLAALSLGLSFFHSGPPAALLGAGFMIALMILLRVFAYVATKSQLGPPATLMVWTVVVLFTLSGFGIFFSVMFRWPRPYPEIVADILGKQNSNAERVNHEYHNQDINFDDLPNSVKH